MNKEYLENAIKGAIIGHLIGDALGVPYENIKNLNNFKIEMTSILADQKPGSWSMPGAFSIATIDSILECESINHEDIMEQLVNVYLGGHLTPDGECRDVSKLTANAIQNFSNSLPLDKCAEREETNNDCLLRILPISLFLISEENKTLIIESHKTCSITNNHPMAQTCCALYSLLIKNMILNNKQKAFSVLKDFYASSKMSEHEKCLNEIESKKASNTNGTKDIIDSFWSAWSCFTKNQTNFENAVISAIKLCNDTNGTACLTGSFSGLYNSVNEIPRGWLYQVDLPSEVMMSVQEFTNFIISRVQKLD